MTMSPSPDAESGKSQSSMTQSDSADNFGYKQELRRNRGLAHMLFIASLSISEYTPTLPPAIIAVPYGLTAPIATTFVNGGPVTMIWGWLLVCVLSQPMACSLAEIASKYPTSAGAYYWCFRLASPRSRLLLSWINGWLTMVGVWTIALSVTFGVSQFIVAGATIFHPTWVATPWQTYVIFLAFTAFISFVCIVFNKALPTLDLLSAYWTMVGIIVILISLSARAAVGRRPISFALGHFDPSPSGWTPGWSFFIGLLAPAYTFSAIGMIASMAEEVRNPAVQVPKAIAWSVPISAIMGLVFLLPIAFTLPDIGALLEGNGAQPTGLMFTLIMGSEAGGFGMWFIVFGVGVFCAISICTAASRATWAFARDKALPFHRTFSRVNNDPSSYFPEIPLNAFLLSTLIQVLLGLLYLGSSAAFNAFVGVAATCLGASYAMPVAINLMEGRTHVKGAPAYLGRWGVPLNVLAVLWTLFLIVIYSMPATLPVTRSSMNYASAVFVGFGAISGVWYMISGRYNYSGPPMPQTEKDSTTAYSS
ncbi:hypothetical protein CCMSSC00406_0005172 [Pleurotus cornucopiae]|uniref:Uncharacterized protein n=1 Tax=Pleurotus cornucopiae TaxID=5321 RepID=A0ACB7IHS6_PLECO|nr:hypothetical protein CCMSSC00406_0005172 [Pleurotus cornucopiae]